MALIIKIALGILLGYLLVENRQTIFRMFNSLAGWGLAIFGICSLIWCTWYLGNSTYIGFVDYTQAGRLGRGTVDFLTDLLFIALVISMFAGILSFAGLLVPSTFTRWSKAKGWEQIPSLLALVISAAVFALGIQIPLAGVLARWEGAWQEWGLAHGMGYDGKSTYDMILWQSIWLINYFLNKFQMRFSRNFEVKSDFS